MRLNDSNKFRAQGSRHLLYVLHKTHHAVGARARPRDNPSGEAHYKPRWPTAEEHLLADDLAELVHIFKENVVVRHGPSPAGEKRSPPEIYVPKRIMFLSGRPRASEYLCRTPLAWTAAGGAGCGAMVSAQQLPPSSTPRPIRPLTEDTASGSSGAFSCGVGDKRRPH